MKSPTKCLGFLMGVALAAPVAAASDLNLSIRSGGQSTVTVVPGETLTYQVVGELSDGLNEGLALFCFDLVYSGGDLVPVAAPVSGPLLEFSRPRGVTNPAGFGGTAQAGDLLQVGGAQNTIRSTFAASPTGTVVTGIGAPGSPVVLAQGMLDAPLVPGLYVLSARNLVANVIRQGEDGSGPFWVVDAAGAGALQALMIDVLDCNASSYCSGKVNSQGCTPSSGSSGVPSLSGGGFTVTCSNVVNNQFGQFFFGRMADNTPFQGGIRCVAPPLRRVAVVSTGGTVGPPQDCSGFLSYTLTPAFMLAQGLSPGTQVFGQWWYRDPAHPDGTGVGLSNGIQFTVCP
jgi:hypothetical protein